MTEAWLVPAGLTIDLMFLASLALLPAGRSRTATFLIVLGACSSAVAFGAERGNNDLVLFALAALAAALVPRSPALRMAGYAAVFLAGLLKYYPMPLMLMALKERPGRFFAVVAVSLAAVGLILLSEAERMALFAGGLLTVSAFFTAQNIGYRTLHLVLTLPALTALARLGAGYVWPATAFMALALLWAQGWRNWFASTDHGRTAVMTGWYIREALWWWTITVLIAVVLSLVVRSEMGRRVFRRGAV